MTTREQLRSRLNPDGHDMIDVIVDGFEIRREWLKIFQPTGWSTRTCWLVLVASFVGLVVGVTALMQALIRLQ